MPPESASIQYVKERAEKIIALQKRGDFIASTLPHKLPLPDYGVSASNPRVTWGRFRQHFDADCMYLVEGAPLEEYLPQPLIQLGEATKVQNRLVTIETETTTYGVDFQVDNSWSVYELINRLNTFLATQEVPVIVWSAIWDKEVTRRKFAILRNESFAIYAAAAVWDPDESQLVAALVGLYNKQEEKAIKAALSVNNTKGGFTISMDGMPTVRVESARKGFIMITSNMSAVNAQGYSCVLLHPLTRDPRLSNKDYFYMVCEPGKDWAREFKRYFRCFSQWGDQEHWFEYMLLEGIKRKLVTVLPKLGTAFSNGWRIKKDSDKWKEIITDGLRKGHISIIRG